MSSQDPPDTTDPGAAAMAAPSKAPVQPGTITAAQTLVWVQILCLLCCGITPVFVWWPGFLLPLFTFVPAVIGSAVLTAAVFLSCLFGAILYAVITTGHLGSGDRRGRSAVSAGLLVVAALAFGGTAALGADGAEIGRVLTSAAPSVVAQTVAWICVHSASAERWFFEWEAFLAEPRTEPEPER